MPPLLSAIAIVVAALLSAWSARSDLRLPVWAVLGALALAVGAAYAADPAFAPLGALAVVCLLIVETDRTQRIIPDLMTLSLLALAIALASPDDAVARVVGAVLLGGAFFGIRTLFTALRDEEALGWGDVKLAAAMGAVLGPVLGFAAVAIAGAATLAVLGMRKPQGLESRGAPFGVGLAAATAGVALVHAIAP